jgi:tRNA-2-methylthio-N6-dimethylallyladenosine synthase
VSSSAKASGKRQRTASKNDFVKLLEGLNGIKGIERIRFMTSHPKDAATGLFRAMAGLDKVCEHLHLPLQSGSDRVLRRMNRGYTAGRYLGLVKNYRKLVRGGSLTTDIIVGFPGETEKDFAKTESLMKEVGFDSAFMFKYSPRPPAKSAKLKDDIPKEIKQKRLLRLIDLQCAVSRSRNEPLRGTVTEVLVDGRNKKEPLCLTGRTRTNKIVIFKADKGLVGKIVNVKIGSVNPHSLIGGIEQ